MSLKIGMVTGEYPPMEGGVGAFTQALSEALAASGHEIHIVTNRETRPKDVKRSLWDIREPYDIEVGKLHPRVGRWWWSAISAVANVTLRYDLDVVNVQFQAAAFSMYVPVINLLPWRLRELTKTIVTFHDLRVPYLFPKAGPLRPKVVQRLARSADGIIVTNQADFDALGYGGVNIERLRQIPIGSNIRTNQPSNNEIQSIRSKLGLTTRHLLLGYFGFLNESKGADILVEAMVNLDNRVHLVFIGGRTGSSDSVNNEAYLASLEKRIADLKLEARVHWSGFLSDRDVSGYLHAADLMVMPYRDGASLRRGTMMAVFAHGRPLITTAPEPEVAELIHGENVWIVPVDDPLALREAIQTQVASPELREKLGQEAARLSEQFTWEKIADRTAAFYEEIIAQGS
jgi:glycosyltransferase involved in cell wall biosynthesis